MIDQADLATRVEVSLIAADLMLFHDFAFNRHLESIRPIAALALMPFLSAFVFESAAYTERKGLLSAKHLKSHENLLRTSRLRLKLLDNDQRSFEEILESSNNLASINSSWLLDAHRGLLGPLRRLLQPDLGVYFLRGEVISTTHVAFLNMGLTEAALAASRLTLESLGPHLHDTAVDLGRYVAVLLDMLGMPTRPLDDSPETPVPPVEFHDLKSAQFYESIARKLAPGKPSICILLTSILSQVNTARILAPLIAGRNELGAFKVGFVSLFHAASSLQKLLNEDRKNRFLHPDAAARFSAILSSQSIRSVRKNRGLRNNLVHYGVDKRLSPRLSATAPLFGLIEAQSSTKSLALLNNDVENGLTIIATGIRGLLPRGLTPHGVL